MAEKLEIQIDIGDSKAKIDDLKAAWTGMMAQLANVSKGAGAVERLNTAMKGIPTLPSGSFDAIKNLSASIAAVQTGTINTLSNELNKLARVDMGAVVTNINALGAALSNLQVPAGLSQISDALGNLARSVSGVNSAAAAIRTVASAADPAAKAVASLGKELINVVGFSTGLSTTLGNLAAPLRNIAAQGLSVKDVLSQMVSQLGVVGTAIAALGAGVAVVASIKAIFGDLLGEVIRAGTELQSFVRTMDAVRGAGAGAKSVETLNKIASETGQSIKALTTEFKQFEAAAASAGMKSEQSAKIFKSVATALSVLGVDAQRSKFAFMALQQMMSKGVVSMEELRRQLGDSLPGAVGIFAEAMGVSQAALIKLVEAGKLASADVLPKVADILEKRFGPQLVTALKQAQAQINAFGNSIEFMLRALGGGNIGGIMAGFAAGLEKLNMALKSDAVLAFARVLGDLAGIIMGTLMGAIGGLATGFTSFISLFTEVFAVFGRLGSGIATFVGTLTGLTDFFGTIPTPIQAVIDLLGRLMSVVGFLAAAWAAGTLAIRGFAIAAGAGAAMISTLNAAMTMMGLPTFTAMWLTATTAFDAFISRLIYGTGALTSFSAGMTISIASLRAYIASVNIATVATTAFSVALKLVGIGLIIAVIVGISMAVEALIGWMTKGKEAATFLGKEIKETSTTTDVATNVINKFNSEMKSSPDAIMASAAALTSWANAQKAAKAEVEGLNNQIKALDRESKANNLAMKEMDNASKDFTAGINSQKLALQEQIQQLQRSQQDQKRWGGAMNESGGAADYMGQRIQRLQRQVQDLDNEIKHENEILGENKRRFQESNTAIEQMKLQHQEAKAVIQEYGVALSTAQQNEVDHLKALGMTKDKAAELVTTIAQLNASLESKAEKALKAAKAEEELAKWAFKNVEALQASMKTELEAAKARGESAETLNVIRAAYRGTIGELQNLAAANLSASLAHKAYGISLTENIKLEDAAKRVAAEALLVYGDKAPKAYEIMIGAVKNSTIALGGNTEALKKNTDGAKSSLDNQQSLFSKFFDWLVQKYNEHSENLKKLFGGGKIEEGAKKIEEGVKGLGNEMTNSSKKTGELGTAITGLGGRLDAIKQGGTGKTIMDLGNEMKRAERDAAALGTTMRQVGEATGAAEGIKKETTALKELGTELQGSASQRANTTTSIGNEIIAINKSIKAKDDEIAAASKWIESGERMQTSWNVLAQNRHGELLLQKEVTAVKTHSLVVDQEKIDKLNAEIGVLEQSKQALMDRQRIMEGEAKIQAQLKDAEGLVNAARQRGDEIVASNIQAMNERIAVQQRVNNLAGLESENINNVNKSLEEKLHMEKNSINADQEVIASLEAKIQKNKDIIQANNERIIAGDALIQKTTQQRDQELSAADATKNAWLKTYGEMGEAGRKFSDNEVTEKVVLSMKNVGAAVLQMGGGFKDATIQSDAFSAAGEKIGEVFRNGKGEVTAYSESLVNYYQRHESAKVITEQGAISLEAYKQKQAETKLAVDATNAAQTAWAENSTGTQEIITQLGTQIAATMTTASIPVQKIAEDMSKLPESTGAAALSFSDFGTAVTTVAEKMPAMTTGLEDFTNIAPKLDEMSEQTEKLGVSFNNLGSQLGQGIQSTDKLEDVVNLLDKATVAADASTDAFKGAVDAMTDQMNTYKEATEQATEAVNNLNSAQDAGGGGGPGGGGGGDTDVFRQGGRIGEAVEQQSVRTGAFDNAPRLASGTSNTNSLLSKVSGGGKPAILHPNEAVVPLSKGRSIPVEMSKARSVSSSSSGESSQMASRILSNNSKMLGTSKSTSDTLDDINKSLKDLGKQNRLDGGLANPLKSDGSFGRAIGRARYPKGGPKPGEVLTSKYDMTGQLIKGESSGMGAGGLGADMGMGMGRRPPAPEKPFRKTEIIINMKGNDLLDNFRYTHDQLAKAIGDKVKKAQAKNG